MRRALQVKPSVGQEKEWSEDPVKYDDASWHYGGDFPKDLPPAAGATHIGMFLSWAILRDLASDMHREESTESLEKVRNRQMTGAEFLRQECDEKFTDLDLSDVGNAFAQHYYEKDFFNDYCNAVLMGETAYHVEDSWAHFDRVAAVLDDRFGSRLGSHQT